MAQKLSKSTVETTPGWSLQPDSRRGHRQQQQEVFVQQVQKSKPEESSNWAGVDHFDHQNLPLTPSY